jgi:hypothetical protein
MIRVEERRPEQDLEVLPRADLKHVPRGTGRAECVIPGIVCGDRIDERKVAVPVAIDVEDDIEARRRTESPLRRRSPPLRDHGVIPGRNDTDGADRSITPVRVGRADHELARSIPVHVSDASEGSARSPVRRRSADRAQPAARSRRMDIDLACLAG